MHFPRLSCWSRNVDTAAMSPVCFPESWSGMRWLLLIKQWNTERPCTSEYCKVSLIRCKKSVERWYINKIDRSLDGGGGQTVATHLAPSFDWNYFLPTCSQDIITVLHLWHGVVPSLTCHCKRWPQSTYWQHLQPLSSKIESKVEMRARKTSTHCG